MKKVPLTYQRSILFITVFLVMAVGTFSWIVFYTSRELPTDSSIKGNQTDSEKRVDKNSMEGRWRLEDMYPSIETAWQDAARIEVALNEVNSHFKEWTVADRLKGDLQLYFELVVDIDHLNVYASLLADSDTSSEEAQSLKTKAESLNGMLSQQESLLKAAFLEFSDAQMERLINDKALFGVKGRLAMWRAESAWHQNVQLSNSLAAFDQLEAKIIDPYTSFWKSAKANYNLNDFHSNNDDKRYQATLESLSPEIENRELLASILESKVNFDNERASAYGYSSALELVLAQDGISQESFDAIRQEVKNARPTMQKWINLQKASLSLERSLMAHDKQMAWYPKEKMTYTEAKDVLLKAFKPYGEDYVALATEAFNQQWIDVYPREQKVDSEYTWGSYKTHPYVFLQYTDDVYSVATLAHEMGHALNNELSRRNQSFDNANNGTLKAEIAATVSELLVLDALSQSDNPNIAYEAQVEAIKTLSNTIFFQMMATEFEIAIHEAAAKGIDLNANYLTGEWKRLIQETYGPNYEVSELDAYGWAHLNHLYWQYYMYKYSIGAAAGVSIETKLLASDAAFEKKYLGLLGTGSTLDTLNEFKKLGIMLDSPKLMEGAILELEGRINRLQSATPANK